MKQLLWLTAAVVLLLAIAPASAQKGDPPSTPARPSPPPTDRPQDKPTAMPTPIQVKPTVMPTPTDRPTVLPAPDDKPTALPTPQGALAAEEPVVPPTPTQPGVSVVSASARAAEIALTDAALTRQVFDDLGGERLLQRTNAPVAAVATPAAYTLTGGAVLVGIGLLAFNLLASLTQSAAVRSLERTYRRQKSQEFELAMARELSGRRKRLDERLQADREAWRAVTSQLFADAGLGGVSPSYVEEVASSPAPRLAIAGSDGLLYVLTTQPEQISPRSRVIPLDAGLSLLARVEAHALWEHVAEPLPDRVVLARDVAWYLVVARRRASRLAQRSDPRHRWRIWRSRKS